jgi:transcriptional regulator with XRE-family HTH domain
MANEKYKPRNTELDLALGQHLRALRRKQGDTQASLAAKVGLTFQQIQKYENGANRVSALMLVKLAEALNTTPSAILESVDTDLGAPPAQNETERLVAAFEQIRSPEMRAAVLRIVASLADE